MRGGRLKKIAYNNTITNNERSCIVSARGLTVQPIPSEEKQPLQNQHSTTLLRAATPSPPVASRGEIQSTFYIPTKEKET